MVIDNPCLLSDLMYLHPTRHHCQRKISYSYRQFHASSDSLRHVLSDHAPERPAGLTWSFQDSEGGSGRRSDPFEPAEGLPMVCPFAIRGRGGPLYPPWATTRGCPLRCLSLPPMLNALKPASTFFRGRFLCGGRGRGLAVELSLVTDRTATSDVRLVGSAARGRRGYHEMRRRRLSEVFTGDNHPSSIILHQ